MAKQTALAKLQAGIPPVSPPSKSDGGLPGDSITKLHAAHNAKIANFEL